MIYSVIAAWLLMAAAPSPSPTAIDDVDKRGYDHLEPILLDVDGDGRPDRIVPRTFTRAAAPVQISQSGDSVSERHFITFDLFLASGRTFRSCFTYRYGDSRGDSWVYALVLPAKRSNGRLELVFYSGDDEGDETIRLRLVGKKFRITSKVTHTEQYDSN